MYPVGRKYCSRQGARETNREGRIDSQTGVFPPGEIDIDFFTRSLAIYSVIFLNPLILLTARPKIS